MQRFIKLKEENVKEKIERSARAVCKRSEMKHLQGKT